MSNTSPTAALEIRAATSSQQIDQVRALLQDYNAYLFTVINPALLRHRETELAELPGSFAPPQGSLLLAAVGEQAVGCVGLRPIVTDQKELAGECCRLWVSADARGQSLGRHLLQAVCTQARKSGYAALYLNCAPSVMATAHRLYLELGFVPSAPYKQVLIPGIHFFRLDLNPASHETDAVLIDR